MPDFWRTEFWRPLTVDLPIVFSGGGGGNLLSFTLAMKNPVVLVFSGAGYLASGILELRWYTSRLPECILLRQVVMNLNDFLGFPHCLPARPATPGASRA